jgi:predicted CoA-binding protein
MNSKNLNNSDAEMKTVLENAKVIAVVGHSDKPHRTSYRIADFLREVGYTVYAVNPTIESVNDEKVYASLADVPEKIDIVNVFRRSEYLAGVVADAIAVDAGTVWSQLGVIDEDASATAIDAGLNMTMNRCIKVEYMRLGIE